MKLSFIGLGSMGRGMAMNLLKKGADLTVFARSPEKYRDLEALGARGTTDLSAAAEADCVFLCLPDAAAVEEVICGEHGLLHYMKEGQTIADCSTITYAATLRIAAKLKERGIFFLDAPVSGMKARADAGTLTFMCGGQREAFDRILPWMECMGTRIVYMGKEGSGQLTKLINQVLYDINAAALAEILPLSAKLGLDSEKVGEVVNSGTGRSFASEFFIPRALEGDFHESYPLEKAYKDLISAAGISAEDCIPLPVFHAAMSSYQTALLMGFGKENKGAMIRVYEKLLGVEFRKEGKSEDN